MLSTWMPGRAPGMTGEGESSGSRASHARRLAADFFRAVFLAVLPDGRAAERVVFLPRARDVFLRALAGFLRARPESAVDASARGLILRSAIAVSLASVAFSSFRLS